MTDTNGFYEFIVVPGTYSVEFVAPVGFMFTTPDANGDVNDEIDSDADPVTERVQR